MTLVFLVKEKQFYASEASHAIFLREMKKAGNSLPDIPHLRRKRNTSVFPYIS